MFEVRRSADRGHADFGWLKANYTFSFGQYFDPDFVSFSQLRVLNQDRVAPGKGFPTHGHENMEIITYVLEGELEHKDSMGNGSRILPGEVQVMSAGSGVTHSEFNPSPDNELHLLQMWVLPRSVGTTPRYDQKSFPESERKGALRLVVSPDGDLGSLRIDQDVRLFAGLFDDGDRAVFELKQGRKAWLHLARGTVELNGTTLEAGDGAAVTDEDTLELVGRGPSEFVLFDLL